MTTKADLALTDNSANGQLLFFRIFIRFGFVLLVWRATSANAGQPDWQKLNTAPPTRVGNTRSSAYLCVVSWPRSGRTAFVITVAPVHCKYGKTLQMSCFYSRVQKTVLWDIYLSETSFLSSNSEITSTAQIQWSRDLRRREWNSPSRDL